ncbi:MAG: polymerase [Eubacterium sp.]|jgi:inhibitor of KinA sporulation pathway (predicted exonuclease)|nr:polymerase [Eubacterium sp.]
MNYIVFDLELNQDFSSLQPVGKSARAPFEIIQIGAVKLDSELNIIETFNRYIKPIFYSRVNPFITELTGITTGQLQSEEQFPEIYSTFSEFVSRTDSIFCVWGVSDIKELFRNVENHHLSSKFLPTRYINIQPYVSLYFNFDPGNLLRLQHAVEALNIPIKHQFHNAFGDAFYTAEIFKKIYNSFMQPKHYDPSGLIIKPRQPRREIDINALIAQFEKMYSRQMTAEEKSIIMLAYKMGKTHQFLK